MALTAPPVSAQNESSEWQARKCSLYYDAWKDALAWKGIAGLSAGFIDQNNAFFASGCREHMQICARSPQEIDLANVLTVMTMNEGMASTFVPFGCPKG